LVASEENWEDGCEAVATHEEPGTREFPVRDLAVVDGTRALGRDAARAIPWPVRVAAALSWRLLLIIAAVGVVAWILGQLAPVTVPVGIALLASGLFAPLVERLVRWRVPRGLATMIAIIVGFAVVGGVFTLIISTVLANLPQLQGQLAASLDTINNWLQHGPLRLSQAQLQRLLNDATNTIKGNTSELPTRALSTAAAVGSILTETLLTLFTLIFFLYGGAQVWRFALRIIPGGIRDQVDVAGRRGFASLVAYVRATVAVAVVDASCIGVGIWVVGVPLAAPLAALIFIGAFVPIIGAVIAGVVAVLVALVAKGFLAAVVVVAILVGVMQLEGHVLQPFLLGRAVRLHPLGVVIAIALGVEIAGIIGALLGVPLLAVIKSAIGSLLHDPELEPSRVNPMRPASARPSPDQPHTVDPETPGSKD
jgi:predicted PurR-regulated permease PerM